MILPLEIPSFEGSILTTNQPLSSVEFINVPTSREISTWFYPGVKFSLLTSSLLLVPRATICCPGPYKHPALVVGRGPHWALHWVSSHLLLLTTPTPHHFKGSGAFNPLVTPSCLFLLLEAWCSLVFRRGKSGSASTLGAFVSKPSAVSDQCGLGCPWVREPSERENTD